MPDSRHRCFSVASICGFLCLIGDIPKLSLIPPHATYGAGSVSASHGKLARSNNKKTETVMESASGNERTNLDACTGITAPIHGMAKRSTLGKTVTRLHQKKPLDVWNRGLYDRLGITLDLAASSCSLFCSIRSHATDLELAFRNSLSQYSKVDCGRRAWN